ncbi:MAG: iron ABC transporter permease [Bacteroidales bacterium]|nr:iron ABC transporter permease [Bacteroidales bacterium]
MNKSFLLITVSVLLLILFSFADILIGSVHIPLKVFFNYFTGGELKEQYKTIITEFRIPKMITAVLAGFALSVAGLQMQTIFRNPLAGPYVLGISSGAGLGVALLLLSPISLYIGSAVGIGWMTSIFACLGAGTVLLIIFSVSVRVKDVMTILIIGVLFGSAVSAVVSVLQYFGDQAQLKTYVIWTMGSLSGVTNEQLLVLIPSVFAGLIISLFSVRMLNILLIGENYAKTSGLNLLFAKIIIFTSTSLLAGSITAFCGPIGFIGIIVPHLARMTFKTANHKILIPASAIIGAILILISDIISQLPGYSGTLPINSVTAILGIPIVIRIILKTKI